MSFMAGGTGTVPATDSGASGAPVWPRESRLELAPLLTAPACARGHVRAMLAEWGLAHLAYEAQTLTSELVTNAVQASQGIDELPPVTLRLLANHQQFLIEVWDHSLDDPKPARVGQNAESGRGLMIVADYSNRWGFFRTAYSTKVVWAELLIGGAHG